MEEQNKSKEVKMDVVENKSEQKYSYEQLNDIANRLFQENSYLRQQLRQAQEAINTIDRLAYLFKVVEIQNNNHQGITFRDEFYFKCVEEIEKIMTLPKEEDKESKEE